MRVAAPDGKIRQVACGVYNMREGVSREEKEP